MGENSLLQQEEQSSSRRKASMEAFILRPKR